MTSPRTHWACGRRASSPAFGLTPRQLSSLSTRMAISRYIPSPPVTLRYIRGLPVARRMRWPGLAVLLGLVEPRGARSTRLWFPNPPRCIPLASPRRRNTDDRTPHWDRVTQHTHRMPGPVVARPPALGHVRVVVSPKEAE